MGEVKRIEAGIKAGTSDIQVSDSQQTVVGFAIHLSQYMVHLDLLGMGLTLNIRPLDAKNLGANLSRAAEQVLTGVKDSDRKPLGLIKEMPAVNLKMPKLNPQTGEYS